MNYEDHIRRLTNRVLLLERENARLQDDRILQKQYRVDQPLSPVDRPPEYAAQVSHVATNGSGERHFTVLSENNYLTPVMHNSDANRQDYRVDTQGNQQVPLYHNEALGAQTNILINKIEQLVRENERMHQRLEWQNNFVTSLQSEKEELIRKCAILENKLNILEQAGHSAESDCDTPWGQILEPLHWISDEQYTLLCLPFVENAISKQKLEENMLHSVVPLEDCQLMEVVETGLQNTCKAVVAKDATTQTKYYEQCLVKLQDCRMCLQPFNESELNGKFCYYHPSRPLKFEEWRVMLPDKASCPGNRKLNLYTCCWTMASKRPPGCVGPRSHETTNHPT